jgi:rhamnogalacturonyl hydrolase YesR
VIALIAAIHDTPPVRCALIVSVFLGPSLVAFTCLRGVVSASEQIQPASFEALKPTTAPIDVARLMAARYPMTQAMSYIPALAWSGALRLSALTREPRWADKGKAEMQPFLSGDRLVGASQTSLASLGGHIAFADWALSDGNKNAAERAKSAADLILPQGPDEVVRIGTGWTDDMYMATAQWVRVAVLTKDERYAAAAMNLLLSYAGKLQRPDGLFIHATNAPHVWGRGNGFASLGMADALQFLPASAPDRGRLLQVYRLHVTALLKHQSDDGTWRQVIDEPSSYRELTATALLLATMARGVRLRWLDKSFLPGIDRAWTGILARVGTDGALRDVCVSTSAAPTKEHYMNRPITNGPDDRAGAMVLLAALEFEELRRAR